jgi:hypothetical protein
MGRNDTSCIRSAVAKLAGQTGIDIWVYNLFLGKAGPNQVLDFANSSGADIGQKIGICNVSYFVGEWHVMNGQTETAIERFKFIADNCGALGPDVKMFPSAIAELSRLRPTGQTLSTAPPTTLDDHRPTSTTAEIAEIDDKNVSSNDRRIALVIGNSKIPKSSHTYEPRTGRNPGFADF